MPTDVVRNPKKLQPFYLLCDRSLSLSNCEREVNGIVVHVQNNLIEHPALSDRVRFGLVVFAVDAEETLPLCDLSLAGRPPAVSCTGERTHYSAGLMKVRELISRDVPQLEADGYRVARPAVFFLTDGNPTEDDSTWRDAHRELTTAAKPPYLIPFGVGKVNREVLSLLAFPREGENAMSVFIAEDGHDVGGAIAKTAAILVGSILGTARSGRLELPSEDGVPGGIETFRPRVDRG